MNDFENTSSVQTEKNKIVNKTITKTICFITFITIIIISFVMLTYYFEKHERIEKYCSYGDFFVPEQISTDKKCLNELISLNRIRFDNNREIESDFFRTDDEKEMAIKEELQTINDERFFEFAYQIINNYPVELEYSNSEILETIKNEGTLFESINEKHNEGDYGEAFSSYQYFFKATTYREDCIYYITNTICPKTFSHGIKERILYVGAHTWGGYGATNLSELITYVNSMPEGNQIYGEYISIAKKQIELRDAEENSKPKHYCVECSSKAIYSYKSPFSGQIEWYCYSCYSELQDLLDQFGMN